MPLELKITMADDGSSLSVTGPVDNIGICYAMLELAKDNLRQHQSKRLLEKIRPATMTDLAMVGMGKRD